MVRDNQTRWNSVFDSIHRAIKLKDQIQLLCLQNTDKLGEDTLLEDDWQQLEDIERILQPFQDVTKRLEGHGKRGSHGSLWECLPAIEALIQHMDRMKQLYKQSTHPHLANSINLAWSKLDEYYVKMDDLSTAERTGSLVFCILWSIAEDAPTKSIYIRSSSYR